MMQTIQLGDLVKDKICGFTGIAVARTQWLTGCDRIYVQPRELHEGKPVEAQWFDETMLDLVEANVIAYANATPDAPKDGGPRNDPKSRR